MSFINSFTYRDGGRDEGMRDEDGGVERAVKLQAHHPQAGGQAVTLTELSCAFGG